jgi:glutamate-1-semialdehyde aminotransferase
MLQADGAYLLDEDGHRYIDLSNAFGSVLLGHADPVVTARLIDAVRQAVPAAASLHWHERLAAQLLADTPGAESVAFFKTGTAATRAAVTAARRATGRRLVGSAGYHGHDPMWDFGPPLDRSAEDVAHFYYVPHLLDLLITEHADELAAVILAPDHVHPGNAEAVARLPDAIRTLGCRRRRDRRHLRVREGHR